jgi:carbonic anhydrase/acetyltransferase-like protein (isoleucine patch superfamily)
MVVCRGFNKIYPAIENDVFIADGVCIIGDVKIGTGSSLWYNAVLRGDVSHIEVGKNTNIQDGAVVHTSRTNGPAIIGSNVTIGHLAMIHACKIHDYGFVGMKAMVMDNSIVEPYAMVAAGAVVTPGKVVGSRELWSGVPAKFVRMLREEEVQHIAASAAHYVNLAKKYKEE